MEDVVKAYIVHFDSPGASGIEQMLIKLREVEFYNEDLVKQEIIKILGKKYNVRNLERIKISFYQNISFESISLRDISLGDIVKIFNLEHMEG